MTLQDKIYTNECRHTCLTSSVIKLDHNIVHYSDDLLPDMYDNNYFEAPENVSEEDFRHMLALSDSKGEKHLKILCREKQPLLADKGMDEGTLLTMVKEDLAYPDKETSALTFRCIKEEDIKDDLIALEVKHYAEDYGMDFTIRKSNRFYDLAKLPDNGLYYFAAYLDGKIAASCSSYYSSGAIGLDDLLTDRDLRHRGIATALMRYVHHRLGASGRPMFLHADADDTPKDMYQSMGFRTIKTEYEYFMMKE